MLPTHSPWIDAALYTSRTRSRKNSFAALRSSTMTPTQSRLRTDSKGILLQRSINENPQAKARSVVATERAKREPPRCLVRTARTGFARLSRLPKADHFFVPCPIAGMLRASLDESARVSMSAQSLHLMPESCGGTRACHG